MADREREKQRFRREKYIIASLSIGLFELLCDFAHMALRA